MKLNDVRDFRVFGSRLISDTKLENSGQQQL